jgi:preprotein translocase subunit YajC
MDLLNILLLAQQQGGQGQGGGGLQMFLMFALLIVVFYFFMIRPQSKRQKEIRKFQNSLENGKHVITSGGIYGKIREVKENFVVVEIADNVRIKVSKNMVYDATEPQQATEQK